MHNIDDMIKTAVKNIKDSIERDEIIGKPIESEDGTLVIPVSKISFGFVSGCGDGNGGGKNASGSALAGGITVCPVGFLVCGRDKRFICADRSESANKWMDLARATLNVVKGDGER